MALLRRSLWVVVLLATVSISTLVQALYSVIARLDSRDVARPNWHGEIPKDITKVFHFSSNTGMRTNVRYPIAACLIVAVALSLSIGCNRSES
jgi:hypothetical protein